MTTNLWDQAVLVDWYVDKLLSTLIVGKLALCHRPIPSLTNLRCALSCRAGQKNENWRMSMAIHKDPMRKI
ncbi:hypothetical protein J8N08_23565 (plasmid) [Agrobacterium tumefaciens]|nr:hypothetical protein [Agrobacterium fabrum]QTQ86200.1 hypothetical protein J8N08_23565 [Agrobacterium tumefaciens]